MPEHQQTQKSKKTNTIFQNQAIPVRQTPVSNPYSIIQRAKINPRSLTRADIMQLQRTIGNQAVGRLLSSIGSSSTAQQATVQRQEMPEEEKCPSCMQRQEIPEEKEPLQGKMTETLQRQEIPEEEEPLQGKLIEPIQRQEIQEEEEPLQGKFENKPEIACSSCFAAPIMQRQEIPEEEEPLQGKMIGTIQRQEIPEEEEPLQTKRENNTGMPDNLKAGVENLSGIDMSDVRVHYNSSKPAEVGALAYTQGANIHVASGQERHLPHEAWHVVQQVQGRVKPTMQLKDGVQVNDDEGLEHEADVMGAQASTSAVQLAQLATLRRERPGEPLKQGATEVQRDTLRSDATFSNAETDVVQRDIGFEFETNNLYTRKSNTNDLPVGGFPNHEAALAAWTARKTTRVKKGAALLTRANIEVQADDRGQDSDLEVVTTHFPLTDQGRLRLNNAMIDLTTLVNAQIPFLAPGGGIVPAKALNNIAGFATTMHDGMILGNWPTATTAPQVTIGTRIGNIGDIVRDLHDAPGEAPDEKVTRDPGRLRMRPAMRIDVHQPRPLNALDDANTLVNGHTLAINAIRDYRALHAAAAAPGGNELEGLLTIIFTYCEGVRYKNAFLKQHTPLMAKTNLSTIFTTMPINVQRYYSLKPGGVSNLESLVAMAPGYAAKMGQPLFANVSGIAEDNHPGSPNQWYHKLTLESWLRGIVLRDRTIGEAFVQFFKDNWGGDTKRPGKDQLTDRSFPHKPRGQEVEGYGALGHRMDTDPTGADLPVFELRAANRQITFAEAQQWALELFDYVRSLNANPGGGYQHIV